MNSVVEKNLSRFGQAKQWANAKVGAVVALATAAMTSAHAQATWDVSAQVAEITAVSEPVKLIGMAVLGILIVMLALRLMRRSTS